MFKCLILLLPYITFQACLDKANLGKLGFTELKDAAEKISGTSTCKGLFDVSGTCVSEA